jgi:hypothetical protein
LSAVHKIFELVNGVWTERTTTFDATRSEVCAPLTALGLITIGERLPAINNVSETIIVSDTPSVLPSAMIGIVESIVVTDTPGVLPSAMLSVQETISITDTPTFNQPPVLALPANFVAEAENSGGATVTFVATALDPQDGAVGVSCSPQSGTVFPFGGTGQTTTTVNCSATDSDGNLATGSFTITVRDTTAPTVTPHPPIVVAATEATGARANVPQANDTPLLTMFLAAGTAVDLADANPQRLPSRRVECAQTSTVIEQIIETTLFPVGQNCIEVAFIDASGNVGRGVATFTVSPPIGGHVNTAGVAVVATDLNNAPLPITTNFVLLQQPGLVTAAGVSTPGAPPSGLAFTGSTFEIMTTALAPPAVSVCFLGPVQSGDRLLWFDGFSWLDRTATVDVAASQICGLPGALGRFTIARPVVTQPTCAAAAGSEIAVTRSGFRLNRLTGLFVQTVTLRNAGTTPIGGPISIVLDNLSGNATLANRTSTTTCAAPLGSPYITMLSPATLAPGQSVTVTLDFANPTNQGISYTARVLIGGGNR